MKLSATDEREDQKLAHSEQFRHFGNGQKWLDRSLPAIVVLDVRAHGLHTAEVAGGSLKSGLSSSEKRDAELAARILLAEELGLVGEQGRFGPDKHVKLKPTLEQDRVCRLLVAESLAPLRRAIEAEPSRIRPSIGTRKKTGLQRGFVAISPDLIPAQIEEAGLLLGLPLTLTLAPTFFEPITNVILLRLRSNGENHVHDINCGLDLVAQDLFLWDMARKYGGPSGVIPYAARIRALRWFYEPLRGRVRRWSLCLRCGQDEITHQHRHGFPLCQACAKNGLPLDREGTIAPGERGTWWFRCRGCNQLFSGPAQTRSCGCRKLSRKTPSKRPLPFRTR